MSRADSKSLFGDYMSSFDSDAAASSDALRSDPQDAAPTVAVTDSSVYPVFEGQVCSLDTNGAPCSRCDRPRSTDNTLLSPVYPGRTLPFKSGSKLCIPCVNISPRLKVKNPDAALAGPGARDHYNIAIADYEMEYRESHPLNGPVKRVPHARDYSTTFTSVSTIKEQSHGVKKDFASGLFPAHVTCFPFFHLYSLSFVSCFGQRCSCSLWRHRF